MPSSNEFELGVVAALPRLKAFAVKLTRNTDAADDLVQETVLRGLAHRTSFADGTNLDAWLFTIMKNHRLSQFRKRRREVEDVDDAFANAVAINDSPLRHLEAKEALRAVDALPPMWRDALRLAADGASIEDMAAELREHDGTIKSRLNRGREMLKRSIGASS